MKKVLYKDRSSHWSEGLRPVRFSDAYRYTCDRCQAKPQEPCTYTEDPRSRLIGRVGKPTDRPHYERVYRLRKETWLIEKAKLQEWLKEHGSILWDLS